MPVHDFEIPKVGIVGGVGCDHGKAVDPGDGGDLAVSKWRRPALCSQPRAFGGVPLGGPCVVRQYGDRGLHDLLQILTDGLSPRRWRQTMVAEEQLVPYYGSGRHLVTVLPQLFEYSTVGRRKQGFGQDVGVE